MYHVCVRRSFIDNIYHWIVDPRLNLHARLGRIGTETIGGPFYGTDGLSPLRLTNLLSVFVEP